MGTGPIPVTPEDMKVLQKLSLAKHERGASSWAKVDCWGLIEMSYEHCPSIKIALPNRGTVQPGPLGLYKCWRRVKNFRVLNEGEKFQDWDILLMLSDMAKREFIGHCGLIVGKKVFHSEEEVGPLFEDLNSQSIKVRKAVVIRHESFCNA